MKEQGDRGRAGPDGTSMNLSDRVRSLRLSERPSQPSRRRYLPWVISFVLLLTTIAFAYHDYRTGGLLPSGAPSGDDRHAVSAPVTAPANVAAVGEVVLQAKGYVTP